MAKLKLKKNVRNILYKGIVLIIVLFIAIFSIKTITNMAKEKKSIDNLLKSVGYNEAEIGVFKEYLSDQEIDQLTDQDKNPYLSTFLKEKYFLKKNLELYTSYKALHPETSYSEVIALVNVRANEVWYTNPIDTDTTKGNLMLVNKFNGLKNDYVPSTVLMSNWYSYGDNYVTEEVYNAFKNLFNAAKSNDLTIAASSSYRPFDTQQKLYDNDVNYYGTEEADSQIARPGFSEHQTGLAIDVLTPGYTLDDFQNSPAYTWLTSNAYLYGFILRYPENKTNLTGYTFESWHYRYVGTEIASIIHNENITFDEYYAYYIAK